MVCGCLTYLGSPTFMKTGPYLTYVLHTNLDFERGGVVFPVYSIRDCSLKASLSFISWPCFLARMRNNTHTAFQADPIKLLLFCSLKLSCHFKLTKTRNSDRISKTSFMKSKTCILRISYSTEYN